MVFVKNIKKEKILVQSAQEQAEIRGRTTTGL